MAPICPQQNFTWHYDFGKVSAAATAVFSYAWLVPAGIYGFVYYYVTLSNSQIVCFLQTV